MNQNPCPQWYVEARPAANTEQMSLDLARHLPRRLLVGPTVIVTDRPAVLLSVVRKRWMKITREVRRQWASTLEPRKRAGLQHELEHMQGCRFTAKTFRDFPTADCFFVGSAQLSEQLPPSYPTLYITCWLSAADLAAVTRNLPLSGLIVAYGECLQGYDDVLRDAFYQRLPQQYERGSSDPSGK